MGAGNVQVTQGRCVQCGGGLTKFQRNAVEWGAGDLIMILLTMLAWLPLKLGWNAISNPWRCANCGGKK